VFTYGQPFYAGWGLTQDQKPVERRARQLTLNELVAGSLLLYPQYIYPEGHFLCELEGVFEGLSVQKQHYDNSSFLRFKTGLRNKIVRLTLKIVSRNS
jgi:capsular polysaccharide export protein